MSKILTFKSDIESLRHSPPGFSGLLVPVLYRVLSRPSASDTCNTRAGWPGWPCYQHWWPWSRPCSRPYTKDLRCINYRYV